MTDTHSSQNSRRVDSVHLSVSAARKLAERALVQLGFSLEQSQLIADTLVAAELCDYSHLGLTRILNLAENPKTHQSHGPLRVIYETPVSAMMDGGNTVACYSLTMATRLAISKAREHGFGIVGLHNSYFSGRGAYYVELAANADLIGIHFASATPMVVPFGGTKPALGTNPIAVAMPSSRGPVVFDAGMAPIMFGDIVLKARLGEELPPGVAVDQNGGATRDPKEALLGGILPLAGHRGYVLSCCVQAMGLLAGAALPRGQVQDYGYLMIVVDPSLLMPTEQFKSQLSELVDKIKSTPPQPDVQRIRFPSERSFQERERRLAADTVTLERRVYDELTALTQQQPD